MKKTLSLVLLAFPFAAFGQTEAPFHSCVDPQNFVAVYGYTAISSSLGKITVVKDRAIGTAYCGIDRNPSHKIQIACGGTISNGVRTEEVRVRIHRVYSQKQAQVGVFESYVSEDRPDTFETLPLQCE